jgi:hypothetical protein
VREIVHGNQDQFPIFLKNLKFMNENLMRELQKIASKSAPISKSGKD